MKFGGPTGNLTFGEDLPGNLAPHLAPVGAGSHARERGGADLGRAAVGVLEYEVRVTPDANERYGVFRSGDPGRSRDGTGSGRPGRARWVVREMREPSTIHHVHDGLGVGGSRRRRSKDDHPERVRVGGPVRLPTDCLVLFLPATKECCSSVQRSTRGPALTRRHGEGKLLLIRSLARGSTRWSDMRRDRRR